MEKDSRKTAQNYVTLFPGTKQSHKYIMKNSSFSLLFVVVSCAYKVHWNKILIF